MKYFSHMNTAVQLLQQYNGSQPFGSFIKQFFSQHKKYGSRDRKNISQLCYAFFRLGKALPQLPAGERILTGLFFCSHEPNELLQHLKPEWNEHTLLPLPEKIQLVNSQLEITGQVLTLHDLFPWPEALSDGIDYKQFCVSFFTQPDLFLRLRPGAAQLVTTKLRQAGIPFRPIGASCVALPNASKIDAVIETDREAVIQDLSSQRIGELMQVIRSLIEPPSTVPGASDAGPSTTLRAFKAGKSDPLTALRAGEPDPLTSNPSTPDPLPPDPSTPKPSIPLRVWDACAASGGKSILARDIFNHIDLTVSDVRKSILINLEKRFAAAGIKQYHSFVGDLSTSPFTTHHSPFDIIITDVPCTGSGTWSRTPEQLYYFEPQQIDRYSELQKMIVSNAIPHLKPGGFLLYCTCSVFRKENEEVVQFIRERHSLQLLQPALLTGYDKKADTLFGAVFQKL